MQFYTKLNNISHYINLDLSLSIKKQVENYHVVHNPDSKSTILGYIQKKEKTLNVQTFPIESYRQKKVYSSNNSLIKLYDDEYLFSHKVINRNNKKYILWYAHELPSNVSSVRIYKNTKKTKLEVNDYLVDNNIIYHDYEIVSNDYDYSYYTLSYNIDTDSYFTLLKHDSVGKETTYEDIDENGNLKSNLLRYTLRQESRVYVYQFIQNNSQIYYKPKEKNDFFSISEDRTSSQYVQLKNFQFKKNNKIYYLQNEYDERYIYNSSVNYEVLNKNVIIVKQELFINESYPLVVRFYDSEGVLKQLYSNVQITESGITGKLLTYANPNSGILYFERGFNSNYSVVISGFTSNKYNYLTLDVNSLTNEDFKDATVYLYVKPNKNNLYHVVEKYGVIISCNDASKRLTIEGSYNSNTYIGQRINLWLQSTSLYDSDNDLLLLAIINEVNNPIQYAKGIKHNEVDFHPFLYFAANNNPNGLYFNSNEVLYLELSYGLLENYGGEYKLTDILNILNQYKSVGKYVHVRWIEKPIMTMNLIEGEQTFLINGTRNVTYAFYKSYDDNNWTEVERWDFTTEKTITLTETVGQTFYVKCEPLINFYSVNSLVHIGVQAI